MFSKVLHMKEASTKHRRMWESYMESEKFGEQDIGICTVQSKTQSHRFTHTEGELEIQLLYQTFDSFYQTTEEKGVLESTSESKMYFKGQ